MDVRSLFASFLDIIFPPRCIICGAGSRDAICKDCSSKVKYIGNSICAVCGKPHDERFEGNYCHECYLKKTPFDIARSVTVYEGVIKDAIHKFKFSDKTILSAPLGKIMIDYLGKGRGIDLSQIDIIIPIPLSKHKLRTREYNQAELLAEEVAKYTGIELDDKSLARARETTPQFDLSAEERLINLKDAFMSGVSVSGKAILLIDDIFTTGTTVKEASAALKKAGAKKIYAFTLARAL